MFPRPDGLCLNPEKTEAVVVGTSERQRVEGHIYTIDTGTVHIKTSNSVKSLGVVIDSKLTFSQHVNNISKLVYFHMKALRHIRKLLQDDAVKTVACTMVAVMQYCTVPRLRTLTSCSVSRTPWPELLPTHADAITYILRYSPTCTGCQCGIGLSTRLH